MSVSLSKRTVGAAAGYTLWVAIAFVAAQLIVGVVLQLLQNLQVPITGLRPAVLSTVLSAVSYVMALIITVGVPYWLLKRRTSKKDIGLDRLVHWQDIGLGLVGFIPYLVISLILTQIIALLVPSFQIDQAQDVGFGNVTSQASLLLAFITLVVIAPVAEETIFRGYLYGKLRRHTNMIVSIVLTSLCFAVLHFQLNVGVDVFALSIILCLLREMTGSIWAGILLHMTKNGIAFFVLFIRPLL